MSWTTPADHTATIVTVNEWNALLGASGNMAYLKSATDTPILGSKNGGANQAAASAINIIEGANITATVAKNGGTGKLDITLAASGGTIPTQSTSSGLVQLTAAAVQGTKGAWEQLIASSGFAAIHVILGLMSNSNIILAYDFGIGDAGTEAVKIADVTVSLEPGCAMHFIPIPFSIPVSSRITARVANMTTTAQMTTSAAITLLG